MATDKLEALAESVRTEGWKWVSVMPRFDYSAVGEMRRIYPAMPILSDEVQAEIDILQTLYEALDDSEDAQSEAERLEQAITELQGDATYRAEDIARAGVIVAIGHNGTPRIERGFVRREDDSRSSQTTNAAAKPKDALPETLIAELTAHRTMALRNNMGQHPDIALKAVVHALACGVFYREMGAVMPSDRR